MIRILGELVVIGLFIMAIWTLWNSRTVHPFLKHDVERIRCLPFDHPINLGAGVAPETVRAWYATHDMADELAMVSQFGNEAEMKHYMATAAKWKQTDEMK
jgi:hypothetical protein